MSEESRRVLELEGALENVKAHAELINPHGYNMSGFWNIANKALAGKTIKCKKCNDTGKLHGCQKLTKHGLKYYSADCDCK